MLAEPSQRYRPNNFDLIRVLASLQVVLIHGIEHLDLLPNLVGFNRNVWIVLGAFPGVPIFFFISGFLISRSYERDHNLGRYILNRFLRVYPGLWVCFGVSIVSVIAFSSQTIIREPLFEFCVWAIAQVTVFQFYNPSFMRSYGVGVLNGSLWTIPVELQFYAAVPVIYKAFGLLIRRRTIFLLFLTFTFFSISTFVYKLIDTSPELLAHRLLQVTLLPYFWIFLLGVIAQRNWSAISVYFIDRWYLWMLAYTFTLIMGNWFGFAITGNRQNPLVVLVLLGLTLSIAFSFRTKSKIILQDNDLSYGLYIYHMIVINSMISLGFTGDWFHLLFACFFSFVLACLSWRFVEQPSLRLKPSAVRS